MSVLKRVYIDVASEAHAAATENAKTLGFKSLKAYLESMIMQESAKLEKLKNEENKKQIRKKNS